jgi:hypothetical protein
MCKIRIIEKLTFKVQRIVLGDGRDVNSIRSAGKTKRKGTIINV